MLENNFLIIIIVFFLLIGVFLFFIFKLKKDKDSKISSLENEVLELKDKLSLEKNRTDELDNKTKKTSYVTDQIYKIEQLEDALEKQKLRVEEAKVIAQEASMVKYDFLTNVSHEIRTPMNSILVFAELLSSELKEKKYVGYAKNIFQSGHKLLRLLDDVIELSKLESGKFKLEEGAVDIRGLLESTLEEKKKIANKKGLKLLLEVAENVPVSFICDGKKIQDILLNLVENGLKFTQKGFVKVKVRVQKENPKNNTVNLQITVEDSGIGIAKESRETIFNIFQNREGSSELELQGTGIGLSINKKTASLINATLSVESKLGVGSRFTLLLKDLEVVLISAEDGLEEEDIDFSLVSPKGALIMIIDEDKETHRLIKDSFAPSAVEVLSFTDPRDAVEVLKEIKIDLIFIDIDIFTIDENAFSKMIAMMSKAAVVTLTQVSIKDIAFFVGGARVIGHLKRPISKVELFKLSIKELNSSSQSTIKKIKKSLKSSTTSVESGDIDSFLEEHQREVVNLYHSAQSTNDLNEIKLFAQKLLTLSKEKGVESLVEFASSLLEHIEHFEIDEINSMMIEYKSKIKSLQSL